jgi:quinolinate synthase
MTPDRNLAQYAAGHTDKKIHLWDGYCPFHNNLTPEDVAAARQDHPDALFMAHPECPPEVLALADTIQSTSGMIRYAKNSPHREFIIGTEVGLLYPISKANPDKQFFPASEKMLCKDMKKIGLEDIKTSLETLSGEVSVPEHIRKQALGAVQKMIDLA